MSNQDKSAVSLFRRQQSADPKDEFHAIVTGLATKEIPEASIGRDKLLNSFIEAYPFLFVIRFYDVDNVFMFSDVNEKNRFIENMGPYSRLRPVRMYASESDMTRIFNESTFKQLSDIDNTAEMWVQLTFMYEVLLRFDKNLFLAENAKIPRSRLPERTRRCIQEIAEDEK